MKTSSNLSLFGSASLLLSLSACVEPATSALATSTTDDEMEVTLASAPSLGAASRFAVLGASTVTCANGTTISGDVGVSPGIAITGFNPDCTASALHAQDATAIQAHEALLPVFDSLGAAVCQHSMTGQDLGGLTLAPGVYCFEAAAGLTGKLTLDGGGNPAAFWIFQVGSALTTATDSSVVMAGGGTPGKVFWRIGSSAVLALGTEFQGNLIASASITMNIGSNLVGRAMAVNAAVTLSQNKISLGN